jgi:23S rRNA pseudouridine1911/1915/1917 synthase
MKIKIDEQLSGQRLDVALSAEAGQTRSQIKRAVKDGRVFVNKQIAKANYRLKAGDELELKAVLTKKALAVKAPLPEIKIIKETDEYIVIDKPAGLLVHSAPGKAELTLVDWLLAHYPKIKSVGDDKARPGIVHRLDRDVSGLMAIAKTQASFLNLKKQFQSRAIVKEYQALVHGAIATDKGSINFLLARSTTGGKMAARPANQVGKEALTEYEVVKHFINYTYLKLIIKTGRTHQIRAHMSAFGCPLVGDDLYGTRATKEKNKKIDLGRIWLFASRLEFADLSGKTQKFKLPLPKELKKVLDKVK